MDIIDLIASAELIAENNSTDSLVIKFNESIKDSKGNYNNEAIKLAKELINKFSSK